MSFILDALRKSETERQHKGSAEFANVPTSEGRREGPPGWLWVLGALLLVNLVVLAGILLRPDVGASPAVAEPAPALASSTRSIAETDQRGEFASRVEAARQNRPAVEEQAVVEEPPATATTPTRAPVPSARAGTLPTIHEVRAQGRLSLPELHVDIHVFSETASDRFVFINMSKHKEGSRLSEGPLVEEITPDGVVLSLNGIKFLLPRD